MVMLPPQLAAPKGRIQEGGWAVSSSQKVMGTRSFKVTPPLLSSLLTLMPQSTRPARLRLEMGTPAWRVEWGGGISINLRILAHARGHEYAEKRGWRCARERIWQGAGD